MAKEKETTEGKGLKKPNYDSYTRKANPRLKQWRQGFSFPYKLAGRPDIAFFQCVGLLMSLGLIWLVFDAIRYGVKPPSVRASIQRGNVRAVTYTITEMGIRAKNEVVSGNGYTPVPSPYEKPVEASATGGKDD